MTSSEYQAEFWVGNTQVRLDGNVTYQPTPTNRDEIVETRTKWLYRTQGGRWKGGDDLALEGAIRYYSKLGEPYAHARYYFRYQQLTLGRAQKKRRKSPEVEHLYRVFSAIEGLRNSINYYSASQFTNPALCPTSFEVDEDDSLRDPAPVGRRTIHTKFLYDVYKLHKENPALYETFVSLVDQRGVCLIEAIKWQNLHFPTAAYEVRAGGKVVTTERTRTMIVPTVVGEGTQLSFNQLSEGTLRTLALIFYIVTDESELLLIEEPEVCVHHGLLRSVVDIIVEYGKTKQIVFSTHSELVVDSLKPDQIMLVEKAPGTGTTVMSLPKAMSEEEYAALKTYLSTVGPLGEYWRSSGFPHG